MAEEPKKQELKEIRAQRLREAREAAGFTSMKQAAEAFGWNVNTYNSHEQARRAYGEIDAMQYAKAYRVPLSQLFAYDLVNAYDNNIRAALGPKKPTPNASFPPTYQKFSDDHSIPLLGQSSAGPNGRFIMNGAEIGRVFCPPMLEGVEGAYAVRVYGTSMEPRFRPGETVWLNPHEPVRADDDVVAQILVDGEELPESYIKRFRSQSVKTLRLWQHNPDEGETNELDFDSADVFSVHKVVFHAMI